ncbi:hypothetical protein ACIQBJ_19960 [Kitasatospora sp. NPDC088391]|uniref:hypothetical protein n=1 Tax=Kitasatospora sp. NPDC088391 TaxID=3364074 RepID=UPI0037FA02F7
MTVRELGPEPAEIQLLRAELDELLRARQFAAQRERRLAEALRDRHEPDHSPAPQHPPRQPDPELARQLAQAQNLREGLGARCLELSNRLLAAEDRLMAGRLADRSSRQTGQAATGPATAPPRADDPHGPGPAFVPSQRLRPTGARFGGTRNGVRTPPAADAPDFLDATTVVPAPPPAQDAAADTPPLRGARFRSNRVLRPAERNAATPTVTGAPPSDTPAVGTGTGPHSEADHTHPGHRPRPNTGPGPSGQYPHETSAAGAADRPRSRTKAELARLVQRIAELHREGAVHESAAIVGQVALLVTPLDLAALAALLKSDGPSGASAYLARSVANGTPEHAAAVLVELRREGLVDEAADLFHTLWSVGSRELPALLAALERTGQSADGQTLLWERASAPAAELAELTHWLREAGRSGDARHLLRQAAGRPVGEVAEIAAALSEGSAVELVRELVRLRSAGDIGQFAAAIHGSAELYDALLFATDGLEESRSRSAFAALRSAGLPTEPAPRPRSRSRQRR